MGFLTINGMLLTYQEYHEVIEHYKFHGVLQFLRLYDIHKEVFLEQKDLHWGEEIEYHIYNLDKKTRSCKLSCDAHDIIDKFNIETDPELSSL